MDTFLFDSANPYDLSQPDLRFIDECINELPENADYNALDICLGDESNNGPSSGFSDFLASPNPNLSDTPNIIQSYLDPRSTLPEQRSINAVSIESHSNPDVDSSMENNQQVLDRDKSNILRQQKHREKEKEILKEARGLYDNNGLKMTKHELLRSLIDEVKMWRSNSVSRGPFN